MTRRDFSQKAAIALALLGIESGAAADVIDPSKKSKAVREEENRIIIKILGFDSERAGDKGTLRDCRLWSCRYQIKGLDGNVDTRTTPDVLSTNEGDDPPTRFQFDLS